MNSGVHKSNYDYAQIYSKFDSFHLTYSISFFLINIDLPSLEPMSLFFPGVCSFDVSIFWNKISVSGYFKTRCRITFDAECCVKTCNKTVT